MSSSTLAELLKLCSDFAKVEESQIAIESKNYENFFNVMPKWSVIAFRPSVAAFFTRPIPFKQIHVTMRAFNKSPWASVLIERKTTDDEPTFLSYFNYDNRRRNVFRVQKLKEKASQAFLDLRLQDATTDYAHGTVKNKNAVLQAGRNGDASQVVVTPSALLQTLNKVFNFDYDPCPVFPDSDAMKNEWGMMNYVNPPFKHTAAFCFRAIEMAKKKGAKSVVICPATVRSVWRYELHKTGCVHAVIFLRSGIKFDGYEKEMPLPMNLLLIGQPRAQSAQVPVFFWDPIENDKRLKPTTTHSNPPELTKIGW